jgi:hypothetical protein
MDRRKFISAGTMLAAGIAVLPSNVVFGRNMDKVRLGYIGVGLRGQSHIQEGLLRDDVEIVAICDTQERSLSAVRKQFVRAGKKLPKEYTGGVDAYKALLDDNTIDAVIIASPWQFHKDQAIHAMQAKKYVGCEVIAGLSVDDHWDLVKTSENTGMPYMTLENVCYRRDVMAVLNMQRQGLFGEMIHLEGGYQHNLRGVLFNDGTDHVGPLYGPTAFSEAQWRTQFNIDRNADIYPTHGVGPLMHYTDINYGNRFTNLVSFSSKARGLSTYIEEIAPGNANAKINYKNGDVTTFAQAVFVGLQGAGH